MNRVLLDIVAKHRRGRGGGIYSICSANPLVLRAAMIHAAAGDGPLLIEATCNQVNQFGGYTGMTAREFHDRVIELAREVDFPRDRILLGGDHLGPHPWLGLQADEAMALARDLVASYVTAGFGKIHLDTSAPCVDDPTPLPPEIASRRAGELCRAAELAARGSDPPHYVIGTEVPAPGGTGGVSHDPKPTEVADVEHTIALHRRAFLSSKLSAAWDRVIAVVVQPGVDFSNFGFVEFVPQKAIALTQAIRRFDGLVYEAHSTDYQPRACLSALVDASFAVLKVGPALTFALREALFALSAIEGEWIPADQRSALRDVLELAMLSDASHWQSHYSGTAEEQRFARAFSLSDRCRYYWTNPRVRFSVEKLVANLRDRPAPCALLRQYLPLEADAIRSSKIPNDPEAIIYNHIGRILGDYSDACQLNRD